MSHVRQWTVEIFLFEEGDKTSANAVLTTDAGNVVRASGVARRSGSDQLVPEIGDEFAAGRALGGLSKSLLGLAVEDLEGVSGH